MNLLLDFGNTRLKWAFADSTMSTAVSRLLQRGAVSYEPQALAAWADFVRLETISTVCYASVVDTLREQAVLSLLPTAKPERIQVSAMVGTLRNAYASQSTLGVDRWLSAIGAWGLLRHSCLIISAGTATTIDLIESSQDDIGCGIYRGGLILPGLDLMRQSLHQATARLPETVGRYRQAPDVADNTQDAIASGAFEATCGAIERMARRLPNGVPWVLTGGNAAALKSALAGQAQVIEDLVLEGLAQI